VEFNVFLSKTQHIVTVRLVSPVGCSHTKVLLHLRNILHWKYNKFKLILVNYFKPFQSDDGIYADTLYKIPTNYDTKFYIKDDHSRSSLRL
jgi:hypothetical protein